MDTAERQDSGSSLSGESFHVPTRLGNLYPITPMVRMLADKLSEVRKEFAAAKKLGWIATAVQFKRDEHSIRRRMNRESRQAAGHYLLRLEGPK